MKHLIELEKKLQKFLRISVVIDPSPAMSAVEVRLQPKEFSLGRQLDRKEEKGKVTVFYIAELPVDIVLNVKGTGNRDNVLLFKAIKYSSLIQHFFKSPVNLKLPPVSEKEGDFEVFGECAIVPIDVNGHLEPVLFSEDPLDLKTAPGFQDRFQIKLVFQIKQTVEVPTVKEVVRDG
ncbi:hypothetical protein GFV12_03160 [Desulfurobacterium thermolithotrophum]|uniref:hypothetical protein n=1 Tax=Desulfurobacterium thermolithotrophum TaxID=64160 RepID=UPI0013D6BD98|nr:hypothetical protein [Desulfurobacterium thermolithotrophum]